MSVYFTLKLYKCCFFPLGIFPAASLWVYAGYSFKHCSVRHNGNIPAGICLREQLNVKLIWRSEEEEETQQRDGVYLRAGLQPNISTRRREERGTLG